MVTAPSHSDHYLRLLEKQLQDAEKEGLHCRLAERDTFILTIIQNAMMEGTLLRTTIQVGPDIGLAYRSDQTTGGTRHRTSLQIRPDHRWDQT